MSSASLTGASDELRAIGGVNASRIKEQLRQYQLSKSQSKSQSQSTTTTTPQSHHPSQSSSTPQSTTGRQSQSSTIQEIIRIDMSDEEGDEEEEEEDEDNDDNEPSVPSMPPSSSTTPSKSQPIGFDDDEEFIPFTSDITTMDVDTPARDGTARGVKRKFASSPGDDTTRTGAVVQEGAYRAPWATGLYTHRNFTLRLHEEILDFCTYVSPKPAEQVMRAALITRIESIVREAFPTSASKVELKPFGSYATKLYLPISDIDLVLINADPYHSTHPTMDKGKNSALGILERTMKSKGNASYLEYISSARIPILKFTDKETNIKVDICYEISGGLKAAEFILQMQYIYPALRPLTLFTKYFLHCRILNDTYKGGIGSFMLQLMLINHLQMLHFSGRLNLATTNLGMILMSFLEFYGCSLNYKCTGLYMNAKTNMKTNSFGSATTTTAFPSTTSSSSSSTTPRTSFYNKSIKQTYNPNRPYLLSIENPLDHTHDVGSNSYMILRVRKALQFAYQTLAAHVFYEGSNENQMNSKEKKKAAKKERKEKAAAAAAAGADPLHPFAASSSTPRTLLSHIVSVNEDLRPGQEELEYDEMEQLLGQEEIARKRSKQVHKIHSDDEEPVKKRARNNAPEEGEIVDDDDDDEDNDPLDAHMSALEKRFVDSHGDDDDDQDHGDGSDDDEDGEDEDIALDVSDDAGSGDDDMNFDDDDEDDDDDFPTDTDFIPLSSSKNNTPSSARHATPTSGKRVKSSHYDFSHTSHPATTKSKSHPNKKKGPKIFVSQRTDGMKPNNQIFESKRAKARKNAAGRRIKKNRK